MLVKSLEAREHISDLKETFDTLRRARMKLNLAKCAFGVTSGKFLGFMEVWYLDTEKFVFAVVTAAQKLRAYFQAHPIVLLTNQPLRKILQKPETSGRMVSWAVELGEFDIQVRPRPAIKSQVLADFIVEFTAPATEPALVDATSTPLKNQPVKTSAMGPDHLRMTTRSIWILNVNGSASKGRCGAGVVLQGRDEFVAEYKLRLDFKASNNKAEYEALLAGLNLAAELGAKKLKIYSDSQLVVEQVNGTYEAKELRMKRYLRKVREELDGMGRVEVLQVPRGMNDHADAISKIASEETHDLGSVYTEILLHPSIDEKQVLVIPARPNWMDPIVWYLEAGYYPKANWKQGD
ncbi:uncharacterized protein LOC143861392 [Tasmannia lanceolata]|uniref:uncharacterized protein LOC143861392 n=1 Tax=Tasmannia lanceolata TaxID=3420 RepID=UPI004064B1FE